jgi:hypothetical protein
MDVQPVHQKVSLDSDQLLKLIAKWIRFPGPKMCKHSVCCDVLSELERNGHPVTDEFQKLVKSIVDADDETSLKLLEQISQPHSPEFIRGVRRAEK